MDIFEEAGYRGVELSLMTDQEESMMVLKRSIAARRHTRTSMIESKVRVSESNPSVERALRKWRGQFRKVNLHLEAQIDRKVPPDHPMVPWMVGWSGDILLKYNTRPTGRTPYEEMTGHRVKHKVAGFGERVHFKVATDTVQDKFDGEWSEGYFVGVITKSSEYLVMRGIQRVPMPYNEKTAPSRGIITPMNASRT